MKWGKITQCQTTCNFSQEYVSNVNRCDCVYECTQIAKIFTEIFVGSIAILFASSSENECETCWMHDMCRWLTVVSRLMFPYNLLLFEHSSHLILFLQILSDVVYDVKHLCYEILFAFYFSFFSKMCPSHYVGDSVYVWCCPTFQQSTFL